MGIGCFAHEQHIPWPILRFWTGNLLLAPSVFVLEIQSNEGDDSGTSSTPAADNTNGWRLSHQTPVFCTSSPISFPSRIRASSFALDPSHIKIAPNHTAGKSFSTGALDWIAVALSIGRNTFFTSQTKNTTTKTNCWIFSAKKMKQQAILKQTNVLA